MFKQKTAYEMRISDWSSDVCSSDLIFIDIMMPRLDGYQACALIKNNPAFRNTPVIMLSSKDGLFDRARGRIVGSDEYLTKPFTRDEMLGAVRAHKIGRETCKKRVCK